ncbi:MAG: thioredoxin family protein [Chitinophagales bacterium]|nr:thioredoxin family protein [Chitinophagales bacterium]
MKKIVFALSVILTVAIMAFTNDTGYAVGDYATDFKLKNVDGKMVSLADMKDAKGYIVIFTCNHCPYSKAYEDRIIDLQKKYGKAGYPVIAINPNDPGVAPDDSFEKMQERAKQKKFNFPYLYDATQEIAKTYGASRTPHVYILQKEAEGKYKVAYIGAIDNDTENNSKDKEKYVENAIAALQKGQQPNPSSTKAIGCTIKWKK